MWIGPQTRGGQRRSVIALAIEGQRSRWRVWDGTRTNEEGMMPEQDDTPQDEPTLEESQEDEKLLDDLDPEEEEAAGVDGGARRMGRWGRA